MRSVNLVEEKWMVCFHRHQKTQPQPLGVLSDVVLLTFKVKPSCLSVKHGMNIAIDAFCGII